MSHLTSPPTHVAPKTCAYNPPQNASPKRSWNSEHMKRCHLASPLLLVCPETALLEQLTMARNLMYIKRLVFLFAAITLIGCGMTDDDMPADELALEGTTAPSS